MIDPFRITDFGRDDAALEEFWIFAVAVAGKTARLWAPKVHDFIHGSGLEGTPFQRLRRMSADGTMGMHMRRVKLGKYNLLSRSYSEILERGLDLRTAGVLDFEALHGVKSKTCRFFMLHSRPGVRLAVIDTHVLKYLRDIGAPAVPASVPTGKEYLRLESLVLAEADRLGMSEADFDLAVWSWYASGRRGLPDLTPGAGAAAVTAVDSAVTACDEDFPQGMEPNPCAG